MHDYVVDMLTNSYSPLVEETYEQITGRNALIEINDRYHLFKLQNFMLEFARLSAYQEHEKAKKDNKSTAAKTSKSAPAKVPFRFDTSTIGVSLQFTSLTFCLDMLEFRVRNPTGK
jgi:hypothetical protein